MTNHELREGDRILILHCTHFEIPEGTTGTIASVMKTRDTVIVVDWDDPDIPDFAIAGRWGDTYTTIGPTT